MNRKYGGSTVIFDRIHLRLVQNFFIVNGSTNAQLLIYRCPNINHEIIFTHFISSDKITFSVLFEKVVESLKYSSNILKGHKTERESIFQLCQSAHTGLVSSISASKLEGSNCTIIRGRDHCVQWEYLWLFQQNFNLIDARDHTEKLTYASL